MRGSSPAGEERRTDRVNEGGSRAGLGPRWSAGECPLLTNGLLVVRDQTELTSPADVVNTGLLRQPTSLASSGPSD
ncbi:hypothetical protein MHYP_G00167280 [Metynnis hypsauchen]